MKLNTDWLKKINKTKAVINFLTEHFVLCAALILLASILASLFIFYLYGWRTPNIQQKSQTAIEKDIYESLMKNYQDKQVQKDKQLQIEYRDIFQ